MKLRRAVSAQLGLKAVKIARNVGKVACRLVYPICIQTYDQVSILRISSKLRLCHAILLRFGLKMLKIALNIMKVGMYSYLPNTHLNLWLNFISKKLVKSKTPLCGFTKVGVKGGENSSKHHESWSARLFIKWASKSMIKFQLQENCHKWNFVVHFRYSSA